MAETIWENLKKNKYPTVKTPSSLASSLKLGSKKGQYHQYGFWIPYTVTDEDSSAWVVETGRVNRSGGESGGHYYVSKKNPNKAVWD